MIFDLQVKRRGFKFDPTLSQDASSSYIKALIERHTTPKQRSAFNGGLCEHLARQSIVNLNRDEKKRIECSRSSKEMIVPSIELRPVHVEAACRNLPKMPDHKILPCDPPRDAVDDPRCGQAISLALGETPQFSWPPETKLFRAEDALPTLLSRR